jgi:predicted transcriptional regulator
MTEWTYPGDDAVRLAFARNILKIIKEKGLTIQEFERRLAEAQKGLNEGAHERAFGRAVKKLRQERKMTRKALAASAGIPIRILIQAERGHGGRLVSVPEVCRIAAALKLRPHELMAHYQFAVEQADRAQAWWRP